MTKHTAQVDFATTTYEEAISDVCNLNWSGLSEEARECRLGILLFLDLNSAKIEIARVNFIQPIFSCSSSIRESEIPTIFRPGRGLPKPERR